VVITVILLLSSKVRRSNWLTQKGMPVRKVARELDIHLNQLLGLDLSKASLRAWLKVFRSAGVLAMGHQLEMVTLSFMNAEDCTVCYRKDSADYC